MAPNYTAEDTGRARGYELSLNQPPLNLPLLLLVLRYRLTVDQKDPVQVAPDVTSSRATEPKTTKRVSGEPRWERDSVSSARRSLVAS